jgi:hypothetical protein
LDKHLHRMGPTYAAGGIKEESAFHFICVCPILGNLRTQIFDKPILGILSNLQKRTVDLRLVFNETSIMRCTCGPISGPRAVAVYNFTLS